MSPFVLAVILVRAIAMTILSIVMYTLISAITTFVLYDWPNQSLPMGPEVFYRLIYPASLFVLPVFMFFKSVWIARLICRGLFAAGSCQRCGYNLVSAGLTKCPECGHEEPKAV